MNGSNQWAQLVVMGILAMGVGMAASSEEEGSPMEKCYGITKAGHNLCADKKGMHSCEGASTIDNDPNEWTLVPKGTCQKVGGKLE